MSERRFEDLSLIEVFGKWLSGSALLWGLPVAVAGLVWGVAAFIE